MVPRARSRLTASFGAFAPARRRASRWAAGLALTVMIVGPLPAFAASITVDLNVEFDSGAWGAFGSVQIDEVGGDLAFTIQISDALGPEPDLHKLYFSLAGEFSNLQISTTDSPTTPYRLRANLPVVGGAGSSFEYAVNFGNGGGPSGNGVSCCASFLLSADQALGIDDLRVTTWAAAGTIPVELVAHVQNTSFAEGADSETVGGRIPTGDPIPEPGTGSLVALSLVALAVHGRARRRR